MLNRAQMFTVPSLVSPSSSSVLAVKAQRHQHSRSTDFEVHRNWLAITHSLPLSKWYFDTGSEWTLDYPPFFAYFEYLLSRFAYIVDPKIVELSNLGYDAWTAVAFQRSTVVISELVLAGALLAWARGSTKPDYSTAYIIAASILLHPGLLIVDHIHFQYNGVLLGILLWSIVAARDNNLHLCAFLFAVLLNFKHIFIYLAPPFFVFLLRRHCFTPAGSASLASYSPSFLANNSPILPIEFSTDRLVELALIVIFVFALSFGPFLLVGGTAQVQQIVSRLFPFQRGLNHAYWAGNVWAIVSAVDRVLVKYLTSRGISIAPLALLSSSRGLIGTTTFGVLPSITPVICFALTLSISIVYLTKLWSDPSYKRFLEAVVLSAFASFLWGWHVHEKAVLLFLIPLSLIAVEDNDHYRSYLIASCAGIYSLFPLLIKPAETPIKIVFTLIWSFFVLSSLRKVVYLPLPTLASLLILSLEDLYLSGFVLVQLYVGVLHGMIFPSSTAMTEGGRGEVQAGTMEFLPLMIISVYCAVGIIWSWIRLSWVYLRR